MRAYGVAALPALSAAPTPGHKHVVISLEQDFQQENVLLTDGAEIIFHFDCWKDAIKKQSNLLVQMRGWKQLFFN